MRLAPAVFTVTSSLDDGSAGTLRDGIKRANSGDTISIVTTQPIVLASQLVVSNSVTIVGSSPSGRAVIEKISFRDDEDNVWRPSGYSLR